jgi:hypothetical protein
MKRGPDIHGLRERIGKMLHLHSQPKTSGPRDAGGRKTTPEWVIVYRTAQGFCCMYRGQPVEFREMLDVQIWAEEMDVETYFIGL